LACGTASFAPGENDSTLHGCDKAQYNRGCMNENLLDDRMKAHLGLEWERFRKALAQVQDIGPLNFEDWRITAMRDRKGLPPAVSIPAVQAILTQEKSGLRGQAVRGGEQSKDLTLQQVAKAQESEVRLQDADHSEVYAALGYYAARRLGLEELHALVFGDALAYLVTGWGQSHTDGHYTNQLILEFKKVAGSPPEGGFLWGQLHSLVCRKGFKVMAEKAGLIGTSLFR
jgi:hypothetical protein